MLNTYISVSLPEFLDKHQMFNVILLAVTDAGTKALADVLQKNSTLTSFSLSSKFKYGFGGGGHPFLISTNFNGLTDFLQITSLIFNGLVGNIY